MRLITLGILFVLLTVPVYAADVDGTWTGSIDTPGGAFDVSFTFKAEGSTLTGTTTGFDGAPVKIENGKVDGNNISYTVTFDFGGMPFPISYKGVVNGDQLKITGDAAGMPFELVLKKSK